MFQDSLWLLTHVFVIKAAFMVVIRGICLTLSNCFPVFIFLFVLFYYCSSKMFQMFSKKKKRGAFLHLFLSYEVTTCLLACRCVFSTLFELAITFSAISDLSLSLITMNFVTNTCIYTRMAHTHTHGHSHK